MQLERPYTLSRTERSVVLEVSDTIVFDFLMDGIVSSASCTSATEFFSIVYGLTFAGCYDKDHDRRQPHNWVSLDNKLLIFDSGLGLRHGPRGYGT